MNLAKGCLLISDPFLPDPHFHRSVILITEHGDEGTHGFVLNHKTALCVHDLFDDFECEENVLLGGPVGKNTFHFIHTLSHLNGAAEILPGVYWGGDFEMLKFLFKEGLTVGEKFVFIAGYSGWSDGQLEEEIKEHCWIVAPGNAEYVFSNDKMLWKHILSGLGGEFKWLSNAPEDLRLN